MDEKTEKRVGIMLDPDSGSGRLAGVLEDLGFEHPVKAASLWEKLLGTGTITASMFPPAAHFPITARRVGRLVSELSSCPDPDSALLNLQRFVESSHPPSRFLDSIYMEEPLCRLLVMIFSCSFYLSDILIRNPGYLSWLIEGETLEYPKAFSTYREELERQCRPFRDTRRIINSIKRYKRREILRIGTRDLLGIAHVEEITAELSFLADAIIEKTALLALGVELRGAGGDTDESHAEPHPALERFSIISLGKLGGTELNYSSDIDLLYVSNTAGNGEEKLFHTSVAKRITEYLTSPTEEGILFRVDLRLRPDGESGPLVVLLDEHTNYMQRRARQWEKQAMLKARHTAGDPSVSDAFIGNCMRFAFDPLHSYDPLPEILTARERAVKLLPVKERKGNIKLMSGGIRDIEFIVQALQLVHGRKRPEIRSRNTLEALERLHNHGLVDKDVHDSLADAYRLFRTVEHRLQMYRDIRRHTIPTDYGKLSKLASYVSHGALRNITPDNFRSSLSMSVRTVRRIFDSFFRDSSPGEIPLVLSMPPGEAEVGKILSRYGIEEGNKSHRFLNSLVYGDFPYLEGQETMQAASSCLPTILEAVSGTPDPALTLKNLVNITKAAGAVHSMLELLARNRDFLRLILNLASLSSVLSGVISRRVELLDVLAEGLPPGGAPEPDGSGQNSLDKIKRWHEEALLHIHCQNPLPVSGFAQLAPLFSRLAEQTLDALFSRSGGYDTRLALFALGSLGAGEFGFASDMDLVAVLPDGGDSVKASQTARRLIDYSRRTGAGNIDFRLRGEGESSPLVQTIGRYDEYLESRAALWELLAFTKCRFICGNEETGREFELVLDRRLYREGIEEMLGEGMVHERERLESLSRGKWDIKHAPGGSYDINFITASASLLHGHRASAEAYQPGIETAGASGRPSVPWTVADLRGSKIIPDSEAEVLEEARDLFYKTRLAAALHGIAYPPLPEREDFLQRYLVRLFGNRFPGEGPFIGILDGIKRNVRRVFLRYVGGSG